MIAASALVLAVVLPASVGVGIGGAPVCPAASVQPGQSVSLGSIYVVNTGSGSEDITLRAEAPANGLPGVSFPASWVSFGYPKTLWVIGRSSVTLSPGQGTDIPATLAVPAGAKPGLYASDLLAGTMSAPSPGSGGQAVFGAGAEENLQFAVAPAKAPSCTDPVVAKVPGAQYAPPSPAASRGSGRTDLPGLALLGGLALLVALAIKMKRRKP